MNQQRHVWVVWASVLACVTGGCVTTAKYESLQPAEVDLSDTIGLAVYVEGDSPFAPKVELAVADAMAKSSRLPVKSVQSALGPIPGDAETLKRAARALVADVLLVGQVEVEDAQHTDTPIATLHYQVIKARSGEPLAAKRTLTYELPSILGQSSRDKVVELAATSLAIQLAQIMSPHQGEVSVQLASAKPGLPSPLREGNKHAVNGDWSAAKQVWELALVKNPTNDKLMYNLGVAFEALGNLDEAEHMYRRAARQRDKADYQAALDRAVAARDTRQKLSGRSPVQVAGPGFASEPKIADRSPIGERFGRLPNADYSLR